MNLSNDYKEDFMAQFKAFAPNVVVNGETVLSVVNGMGVFKKRCCRYPE
jgi:hypothetical protein